MTTQGHEGRLPRLGGMQAIKKELEINIDKMVEEFYRERSRIFLETLKTFWR